MGNKRIAEGPKTFKPIKTALPTSRNIWKTIWVGTGMAIIVAIVVVACHNFSFLLYRFGVVTEGVLYRSSRLSQSRLKSVVKEYRIKTVINLMTEDLGSDKDVAKELMINYVWLPSGQVPTQATVDKFLEIMDNARNYPVLVHCQVGVGRTGVMVALYRIEKEHWKVEQAIAEARRYALWGSFDAQSEKTTFLKRYIPRIPRVPHEATDE